MRSKLATLLASLLVVFAACEGQPERIEEVCESVGKCSGFVIQDCSRRLEAAVDDHRLSQPGLARCADCLANNVRSGECADVLVARDCDKACGEIQLVLNARTSTDDRRAACTTFHGNCGDVLGSSAQCAAELKSVLEEDPTLSEDLRIGDCLSCIKPFKLPTYGAGGAGGDTNGPPEILLGLTGCSTIIERCGTACDNVTALERRFDFTQAALAVCRRGVRNCLHSMAVVPGAGGEGGEPAKTPEPLEPQPLDDCYVELVTADADTVQKCSACEAANPICDELAANCLECRTLYPAASNVP